jgi:hypothetical protein
MSEEDGKSSRSWREIAEEASHEKDSNKLVALLDELERAFEEQEKLREPLHAKHKAA